MTPTLVPFKAEHLLSLNNRDGRQFIDKYLDIERSSVAYTGMVEGKIIGCAGIIVAWDGVGMAWAAITPAAEPHMIWVSKIIRRFMRDIIRAHKLHRVEMVALADSQRNQRWAEFMGFSREGSVARQYTTDRRDMIRYEWVKNNG